MVRVTGGTRGGRGAIGAVLVVALAALGACSTTSGRGGPSSGRVLYVGRMPGISTPAGSTFSTIQAAVDAAKRGDWILVAPGDYHESGDMGANAPSASAKAVGWYGAVDIETPDLHLRGTDRNRVIVDGTLQRATAPCSSAAGDQNALGGAGRNGIVVWKASGVSIDNLTVCNFLNGSGYAGNGIWWNGGANSSKIGLSGYSGSYLTATSTYFAGSDPAHANVCAACALYGIFASNAGGPSTISRVYANNFSDSGIYVGACLRQCDVTIDHAWMEDNALGYSGTNSGGRIVIERSTFDDNKDGFDTNTALTGDPPPPQDGRCPEGTTSAITGGSACWVFLDNLVAANNNPDVPIEGTAGLGPTGTGMTVSGGRNDVVQGNRFLDNGAWGVLFLPYPDPNTSSDGRTCAATGGIGATALGISGIGCLFDPTGDMLSGNRFSGNGTFGNPGNADFGNLLVGGGEPANCFTGNTRWDASFNRVVGPASSANAADGHGAQTTSRCGVATPRTDLLGSNTDTSLLLQVECDAGVLSGALCASAHYPQATAVTMHPLPRLPSMPDPCSGVPANLWCPKGVAALGRPRG